MARRGRYDDHQTRTPPLNITPGGLGPTEATLSAALIGAGLGAGPALAAVLLYRLASFWLVALTEWLILFWLRGPQARPAARSKSAECVAQDEETAAGADAETDPHAAGPGPHELVLPHGQPGSPADWQQVAARLPARLHAVAPDRPGYGSSPLPARASPRTPAPSSMTWTHVASSAPCWSGTPTAAG